MSGAGFIARLATGLDKHRGTYPPGRWGFSEIGHHAENPPPRAKCKKGGGLGGVLRGVFAVLGYCPQEGHTAPQSPPPPPMKYILSATSKQLGMWPRCDRTIRTAPTNVYGRVSLAWVFPAMGTRNLGTVGLRGGHGVRNTTWG